MSETKLGKSLDDLIAEARRKRTPTKKKVREKKTRRRSVQRSATQRSAKQCMSQEHDVP